MTELTQLQAREDLKSLAYRAVAFFNMSFAEELADLSPLSAEERDHAFHRLRVAVRADNADDIDAALDVLIGGAR